MNVLVLLLLGIAIIIIIYLIARVVWWFINTTTTLTSLNSGKESITINGSKIPNYNNNYNFTYSLWLNINDWNYRYGENKVILQRDFKNNMFCPKIYFSPDNNTINILYTYIIPGTNTNNPITKTDIQHSTYTTTLNEQPPTTSSIEFSNNSNSDIELSASNFTETTLASNANISGYKNTIPYIQAINEQGDNGWGTFSTAKSTLLSSSINEYTENETFLSIENTFTDNMTNDTQINNQNITYTQYQTYLLNNGKTAYDNIKNIKSADDTTTPITLSKANILLTKLISDYITVNIFLLSNNSNTDASLPNIDPALIPLCILLYVINQIIPNSNITNIIVYILQNNPNYRASITFNNTLTYTSLYTVLKNAEVTYNGSTDVSTIVNNVQKQISTPANPSITSDYCQLNDIFIDYNIKSYGSASSNAIGLPSYYNPNYGFNTISEAIQHCNNGNYCGYVTYNPDTKKYYLRSGAQGDTSSSLTYFKPGSITYMRNGAEGGESSILTSYCNATGDSEYIKTTASLNNNSLSAVQYMQQISMLEMVPLQEWFNVIFSFNQNILDIYLNGKLVKSEMIPGTIYNCSSTSNVTVTPNGGFDGWTSSIQYLDNAISPEQAYNMYNTGFGGGIFGSLFDKYKVKFTLMHGNVEDGSYTI